MKPIDFNRLQEIADEFLSVKNIYYFEILLVLPMLGCPMEICPDYKAAEEPRIIVRFKFGNPFESPIREDLEDCEYKYSSLSSFYESYEFALHKYKRPKGNDNPITKFFNNFEITGDDK